MGAWVVNPRSELPVPNADTAVAGAGRGSRPHALPNGAGPGALEVLEAAEDRGAAALLRRNLLIYGLGGIIAPFIGIWIIDRLVSVLHLA